MFNTVEIRKIRSSERPYSLVVTTLDSDSSSLSSNLGTAFLTLDCFILKTNDVLCLVKL